MRIKELKPGFEQLTKEKARLIGHLIGDGCVFQSKTDYNIKYEVTDPELLQQFERDLVSVYGLPPTKGVNPSGKTGRLIPLIRLRSKRAFEDLKRYCEFGSAVWRVPTEIRVADPAIQTEFLRALFDDEGSVVPQGKYFQVRLYSINRNGLLQIQELLSAFFISSKLVPGYGAKRNVYGLRINERLRFSALIGFSLKRKQQKLERLLMVQNR